MRHSIGLAETAAHAARCQSQPCGSKAHWLPNPLKDGLGRLWTSLDRHSYLILSYPETIRQSEAPVAAMIKELPNYLSCIILYIIYYLS